MGVFCTNDLAHISWPPRVGAGNVRGVQPVSHDFAWRWEWNYRPMAWRSRRRGGDLCPGWRDAVCAWQYQSTALHVREMPDDVALDAPALARVLPPEYLGSLRGSCFIYDFYNNSLPPTRPHDYDVEKKESKKKKKTCTGALSSPSIRTEDGVATAFIRFSPCSLAVLVLQ